MAFDDKLGEIDFVTANRRDEKDKENEIETGVEGDGNSNHMKESQEEEGSTEVMDGPGGLAGLIANLSGVIC